MGEAGASTRRCGESASRQQNDDGDDRRGIVRKGDDAAVDGDDEAKRRWRQATAIVALRRRDRTLVR